VNPSRSSWRRPREGAAAFAACLAASVIANAPLLRSDVVSDDALVHQFWMRHWQDPGLFNDPLTTQLRESVRYPDGYQALFWLATHAFEPIAFGEWLGVGLMALSGWLVFRIVREQEIWRPAAWIGAALFLSLLEILRFAGGSPRAFVQPAVLLTVLLAMRGRDAAAAVVAGGGALFHPPAGVLAVGVLALSAILRAVYGTSPDAITELRTRYGATHLWIRAPPCPAAPAGVRASSRTAAMSTTYCAKASRRRFAFRRRAGSGGAARPRSTTSPAF
jgi:hypothetical protein